MLGSSRITSAHGSMQPIRARRVRGERLFLHRSVTGAEFRLRQVHGARPHGVKSGRTQQNCETLAQPVKDTVTRRRECLGNRLIAGLSG
jgi:hypothetical protein